MGPQEPYWRTNTSFSPPPSRWDFRFQSEAPSFGSQDGAQFYGSSASSNSRESRSWVRGSNVVNHQYLVSDGVGPYYSSLSEISPAQQWTPPIIQEITADDRGASRRDLVLRPLSFSPTMEGTSAARNSRGSTSSRSDSSCDSESIVKSHWSHRNFSSRRCFMSKAVHPLSFPSETPTCEAPGMFPAGPSEVYAIAPRTERYHSDNVDDTVDLAEMLDPFEHDILNKSRAASDCFRCGLCERLLSQRSPWSSRRIIKSGDMPVAGVLPCRHVFHAECLDQTTPKARKNDPPCPLCAKFEEESSSEQRVFSKLKTSFPQLKPVVDDGPSKSWGCTQAGDCVEGAIHTPTRNTLLSLNRSRIKKNISLRSNPGREFPGKIRKSESYSSQLFIGSGEHGGAGSSKLTTGSTSK